MANSHVRSITVLSVFICAMGVVCPGPAMAGQGKKQPSLIAPAIAEPLRAISISPSRVVLNGPYAEARLLIDGIGESGKVRDVSHEATIGIVDPKIVEMDDSGIIHARMDGRTILRVRAGFRTAVVPIEVRGVARAVSPKFVSDVMPVLTKAGCNQGACHGAGSGKGGFKISLLGYDPEFDYEAIVRGAAGRRLVRSAPEQSLLLRKPTLAVVHKGGQRFRVGSPEYRVLADWIASGASGPDPKEPTVVRLKISPSARTLGLGDTQRFVVKAIYSDGSSRDATGETVFTASDDSVATVSPDGEAKVTGPGEGAVLVRYQSLVATARVISPFADGTMGDGRWTMDDGRSPVKPRKVSTSVGQQMVRTTALSSIVHRPSSPTSEEIDRLIDAKLAALGLKPSPRCSDSDLIRRAYLDVTGTLPSPAEARAFLADRDREKRAKLIDALLGTSEYVDFWSLKWSDLLRSSRKLLSDKGMAELNYWIRQSVSENKPWDQFVKELLLARGSTYEVGPANFFRTASTPETLAETTSTAFLGVRIQCARCHNHPYEKWTQTQYYQMAAFFARVERKKARGSGEQLISVGRSGEVKHLRTDKETPPCALDSTPLPAIYTGDRREPLADWVTSPTNPFFAKIIVNRIWKHYMARGLVEPVDDLRVTNPASNEELFGFMAKDLASHGFDLKHLMRSIMLSRAYQRSAIPTKDNARDTKYLSHYAFKRLSAEQLDDALSAATGASQKFDGFPLGLRAAQLPDTGVPSYFLDLFGRPARNITCDCERNDDPNLGQVLHLMNNQGLNGRIADKTGRVAKLIAAKVSDQQLLEEIYLAAYSRLPMKAEQAKGIKLLTASKNRQQSAEDLLWALLNAKEFMFNH